MLKMQVELTPVQHMVYGMSSLEKDLDLRLMLFTKRTVTSLTVSCIKAFTCSQSHPFDLSNECVSNQII